MVKKCFLVFICVCFFSCNYFSFKKEKIEQELDTLVTYTEVDTPPTFKECDHLIDKNEQSNCFREAIHKRITESLQVANFRVKKDIDEVVIVTIKISSEGKIHLKKIALSKLIKTEIPLLTKNLDSTINQLPIIFPALKRSIPVSTEYILPIRIKLKN